MAKNLEERRLFSQLLRMVAINAYAAWTNTLVGNPAPAVKEQFERTTNPQPGDVVLETSTVWTWAKHSDEAPRDQYPALGVLLRVVQEPIVTAEQLSKLHAEGDHYVRAGETLDEIPKERVTYIRPLDGSVPEYRWTNASFIRVFASLEDVRPSATKGDR